MRVTNVYLCLAWGLLNSLFKSGCKMMVLMHEKIMENQDADLRDCGDRHNWFVGCIWRLGLAISLPLATLRFAASSNLHYCLA
jgi:hypothetical protein